MPNIFGEVLSIKEHETKKMPGPMNNFSPYDELITTGRPKLVGRFWLCRQARRMVKSSPVRPVCRVSGIVQ